MDTKLYLSLRFRDADAGLQFLKDALGFEEHAVYRNDDGGIVHAELALGDDIVMCGQGDQAEYGAYLGVEDIDAAYAGAKAAGATIVREPADTDYGSREFAFRDPDGHLWSVGTYRPTRE